MYKSCKDLEKSLYVAPNEVRSCCQRYFFQGKMRGDAKLLDIRKGITPKSEDIIKARKNLFDKIQKNEAESCKSCPFLYETNERPNFDNQVTHLSIEHHSVCNLRCTYCSETYYGGKRSDYDVIEFVKYLSISGAFKNCKQVVWGGGEPTLDKSFELIVNSIEKFANPNIYHRVFTNSVRYSESLKKFLDKKLVKIVTSIDSGTEETFKKVRGRDKFYNVFENLKLYSEQDPRRVTIKYIMTEGNTDFRELNEFVNTCIKYSLNKCNFQISLNYKFEILEMQLLKSVIYLMGLFKKNNILKFFCDDHIASRFTKLGEKDLNELRNFLISKKLPNIFIFDDKDSKGLNIYGAGDITENMLKKSKQLKYNEGVNLYDSDQKKIGKNLLNFVIKEPKKICDNDFPIFISAAQSYDDIYNNILKLNINENRIVSGLIV